MHAAIAPWSSDALAQIRLARAFMLGVFLLTALVCQRLASLVLEDPVKATAAALLTTSGYYFMHYKDMVDFAQPGVLAMLVLMLAIGRRLRDGCGDRHVLAAAILAASLGVGLPSVAVAGSWFGCEALVLAARRVRGELGTRELARQLAASTAWRAIAIGGLVAAAWLVYCTTVEMVIRDVSSSARRSSTASSGAPGSSRTSSRPSASSYGGTTSITSRRSGLTRRSRPTGWSKVAPSPWPPVRVS